MADSHRSSDAAGGSLGSHSDIGTTGAVLRLIGSTPAESLDRLKAAIEQALTDAEQSLDENRRLARLSVLEGRHAELRAYKEHPGHRALSHATWLLVLSHLDADSQRLLQSTYEELLRGAEAVLVTADESEEVDRLLADLAPVDDLLAELPFTTLEQAAAHDDHDSRRRSLMIEVRWPEVEPDWPADAVPSPVSVRWVDGYEREVASMALVLHDAHACWILYFDDPAEGDANRIVPRGPGDPREVASRGLADAIEWANGEIGDGYTFKRSADRSLDQRSQCEFRLPRRCPAPG